MDTTPRRAIIRRRRPGRTGRIGGMARRMAMAGAKEVGRGGDMGMVICMAGDRVDFTKKAHDEST